LRGQREKILNLVDNITKKSRIIRINNNDDNLCCPRAIVVSLVTSIEYSANKTKNILGKELSKNQIQYLKERRPIQKKLALKLCSLLTTYNSQGFTLDDIYNVECILNIQINIICAQTQNKIIYKGIDKDIKIYLFKRGNHFDVITKIKGFYGTSYYCNKYDTPYSNKDKHKCKDKKEICLLCKKLKHLSKKERVYCEKCYRYCFNQECLESNQEVCEVAFKCLVCNKICMRSDEHKCGVEKCRNCWKKVEIAKHKCYIQWLSQKGGKCKRKICLCKGNVGKYIKHIEDYNLKELRIKAK